MIPRPYIIYSKVGSNMPDNNRDKTNKDNNKESKPKYLSAPGAKSAPFDPFALRKKVANSLQVERWLRQMSQSELAESLGTSKSNISRIESGRQNLTVDYVAMMAEALDKQVEFRISDKVVEYGDSSEYWLKLYDENLMKFRLENTEFSLKAEILWVNEEKRHLFPLDLELTGDGVIRWLSHRIIPRNREMVDKILDSLGLDINSLKGIIDICMGLSLNDSYWTPQVEFDGTFEEYNLYENSFNSALSLVAYTGYSVTIDKFRTSPELTTNGMLRKAWSFSSSEGIYLYKGGTEGFANAGNEPYCEFYASQVAKAMGLHAIEYDLVNWHGIVSSKCKLFTDIDTSYVPIGRVVKKSDIDSCIDFYKELGDSFYQELASMLVFDAVILNEDRHFGNFGLLRDNHSGEFISPAPIFDNGLSLLCYGMKSDFGNELDVYIKKRTNPYGYKHEFISLARRVMGPLQREQLRKLIGFKFEENDYANFPSWRIKALEDMIQTRVIELIK